jgi:hypothetical protein
LTGIHGGAGSRDAQDVDALIIDRYLDSIFAAHGRGADSGPVPLDLEPPVSIRLAAARLARELPRLHPSFRFEEALATKLDLAAARMRLAATAGRGPADVEIGAPISLVRNRSTRPDVLIRVRLDALRPDGPIELGRPLLIGGAITSAALSIAGAAYVAWRFRRPGASPMVRAVRAVARTRLA